jgi:hypothetical protein
MIFKRYIITLTDGKSVSTQEVKANGLQKALLIFLKKHLLDEAFSGHYIIQVEHSFMEAEKPLSNVIKKAPWEE